MGAMWEITGDVRVSVFEHDLRVYHAEFKNMVVALSRRSIGNLLRRSPLASGVNAIAIGDGSVPPTIDDIALGNERFRQSIPSPGTDTPVQKNLISDPPGAVVVTFAQWITPFVANAGTVAPGGLGASFFVAEFGLFTDIVAIADPLVAPTLAAHSPASGSVTNNDYTVKITWENANGETLPSPPSSTLTLAGQGGFLITLPAAPSTAVNTRIYIKTGAGLYYFVASVAASVTTYDVSSQPAVSTEPPLVNTSVVPGKTASGSLLNRAILPSPVELKDPQRILIESALTLG